ncbi:hypothetical protein HY993_04865 [Candidatus Micrarchaeota archaeon]|nr:hypothetical protein [Candidatus Micrarchaeota archaeon]
MKIKRSPLLEKILSQPLAIPRVEQTVFGPSAQAFVGHRGYPSVNLGPLVSAVGDEELLTSSPDKWFGLEYEKIILMRTNLVRGKKVFGVRDLQDKHVRDLQDVSLSVKPVDVEVEFEKKPFFTQSFNQVEEPHGPSGNTRKLTLAENPGIPRKVDEFVNERVSAKTALGELSRKGLDYYYLEKIFSLGLLGADKKIVPTRWSITAVDKNLADENIERIKECAALNEYRVYSSVFLDNYFSVLLIPGAFEFEQFEAWRRGTNWNLSEKNETWITQEYEGYYGRKDYASSQVGGYYAARLAVSESLLKMRKQAKAIVFREIGGGYSVPLGVWQVRENVKNALRQPPAIFNNLEDSLGFVETKVTNPIGEYKKRSQIIGQKRLVNWI